MTAATNYLRGDPVSLVATNIPTFMGGRANPWMDSENYNLGLSDEKMRTISNQENTQYKPQSFSDGYLELTSVQTIVDLAQGNARRLGQAEGSITLRFNEMEDEAEDFYSFFQVDGEFFKMRNPTSLKLQLSQKLQDGSIRVLTRLKSRK